ncbi:MAG TPA: hypothetical protein PLD62_07885, partial [Candidatus Cloacimonadota bacterium]|nr:hypothetical protein [Candidatus Cloacimonadota bacterium]
ALHADVPIIPVAHYGGEYFWYRISRFKRTNFTYKVGKPLVLKKTLIPPQILRHKMLDQLMYRLAALLPEKNRGEYWEINKINDKYMEEIDFEKLNSRSY